MDSDETKNDMIAPNSSDFAPVQDSTTFSYINDMSPVKPFKGALVAQSFPGLGFSPEVFTSPRINPQILSSSLKSEYPKSNGDKNDDVAQVNSHDIGHSSNNAGHGEGGITSESTDKYWKYLLKVVSDDLGHVANSSLKQSDTATPSSKDLVECINYDYDSMNSEQHSGHSRTELQLSTHLSQLHTCGGEPEVILTEQDAVLHASMVSQQLSAMPTCCPQYDESQQNTVAEICGSTSQSNAASASRLFSSEVQVLESSCAAIYAPPNSVELENIKKPTSSTYHASKVGRSSIAVPKSIGIGLHLNSILNALPMGCGASASVKSADGNYMTVQGKKSFGTTDSRSTENTGNSSPSSKGIDGVLKPTEHHSTSCNEREDTKLSPQKKRKRSTGFSDGDGCKRCNCKKTKCLKLYCDCFAAGYYCAQTCSCQGCFNSPEYEDTVLDTRKKIVSRDPLAFVPKTLQHSGESPASDIQDINKSTPSSARHKRGCNCKKSMCLKRYCECYQSNVGCSDGCRCDGCQNVYGKKEEYDSSNIAITEVTNDIPEISFDQKLDTILHSKNSIPHNMTPFTALLRYPDDSLGKDALHSRSSYGRCGQSPEADIALSATHEKPLIPTKSSNNHKMVRETCQTIPYLESSDMQLYYCNSKRVDDVLPHRRGNNSLSTHHNPRSMAVACLMSQTTKVMTNDTSCQPCPESGSFSSLSSRQLCSSPLTSVVPFGENKLPWDLDSNSKCYNISEDDDIPELLKDPISFSEVKVRSPNKKRISPPHDRFCEITSSSSITALKGGRKFVLKAVPSFPPLAPCADGKSSPSKPALNSNNMK